MKDFNIEEILKKVREGNKLYKYVDSIMEVLNSHDITNDEALNVIELVACNLILASANTSTGETYGRSPYNTAIKGWRKWLIKNTN